MPRKTPLSVAISTTLAFAAGGLSFAAYAQDANLEEVVVTGSRIARADGFSAVAPVSVVSSQDIKATGMTRMEDVLNSLPSIQAADNSFQSNGATGTASIDLRGLGSNRTLVLFNGRRMQSGGIWTLDPDINQIPTAMVERVEVLTGGASATYGADAVAGVVNFIMRRVNGVEISGGASGYQHDNRNDYIRGLMDERGYTYPKGNTNVDGKAYNLDLVMGSDFADGRGNATAYATWRQSNALRQGARDYSACALDDSGTACGGSGSAPNPNYIMAPVYDGEQDWGQIGYFTLAPDSSLEPWTTNYYNFAPINYFMRPEERWSLGAFVDYEVNANFHPYLEANYAGSSTTAQIAESGTFFADEIDIPLDSPLFPTNYRNSLMALYPGADSFAIYVGKRNVEGGARQDRLNHDAFRIVTGAKGKVTDNWDYDVYYQFGQTNSSTTYVNDLSRDAIIAALGPDCASTPGGCYQVFTYNGVTTTQAAALQRTAIMNGVTSTEVISGVLTGDLGFGVGSAGNVQVAGGFEHRSERYSRIADSIYAEGALAGQGGPTKNIVGGYNVTEWFGEANVPLLKDVTGAQSLSLDFAYRYSDYSTIGTTDTYRIGLDWKPVDMVRFRTGFNHAVRAPNVGELYLPNTLGLWSGSDPCAGTAPEYTAAECANQGVTAAQYGNIAKSPAAQYNQFAGGNPNLKPESADTVTAGFVLDPIDNLTISVDYWDIKVEDTIGTMGASTILETCSKANVLCEYVVRSPTGSLWLGQAGYVINPTDNFGKLHYEGIDLAAVYSLEALSGSFNFNLLGTYLLTKNIDPLPSYAPAAADCVGVISAGCASASGASPVSPEWRHTFSVGYDSNEFWAVGAKWRYFQGVKYEGTTDLIVNDNVGSQSYFDLNATFRFLENSDVMVGVNNVLDEEPPMMGATLATNANTAAGFYDTLGRFLFINATVRF
jgi:iron complex outermembrane receptor protein